MKQQDVFKKVGEILNELSDQYNWLQTTSDSLNDLELELFIANAHFLTEHIEILCKLNQQKALRELALKPELVFEPKYFEPLVQQVKPIPLSEPELALPSHQPQPTAEARPEELPVPVADITPEPEPAPESTPEVQEKPETIRYQLELDESQYDEDEDDAGFDVGLDEAEAPLPVNNVVKVPVKPENKAVEDDVPTINQKISAMMGNTTMRKTEQAGKSPIADLKQAITLNDKLLFVKDLFNGYNLAYSEAIEILNRFTNFEEADRFLKVNYAKKNNWDSKPATTEKFNDLVRRRYM